MNSLPLSESIPMIGNGKTARTCSRASKTHFAALRTLRLTVHPVAISATVSVNMVLPGGVAALVADQVDLTNPGTRRPIAPQIRTGIWDFNSDPALVWGRPRGISLARSPASRRSMVAALIATSSAASSSLRSSSPSRRRAGTRVASKAPGACLPASAVPASN